MIAGASLVCVVIIIIIILSHIGPSGSSLLFCESRKYVSEYNR